MRCNWTPLRDVCPNYELGVLKPRTVNPPHLGSIDYHYTFKLGPLPHLFLLPFQDRSFNSSVLPPLHPYPFIFEDLSYLTCPPPHLPVLSATPIFSKLWDQHFRFDTLIYSIMGNNHWATTCTWIDVTWDWITRIWCILDLVESNTNVFEYFTSLYGIFNFTCPPPSL